MSLESDQSLPDAWSEILRKVEEAKSARTQNRTSEVTIIAVSKTKPKEDIIKAYSCGCRHFGENYVNELVYKASNPEILEMCPDIKWHFIGHLQSNKVNKLIGIPNLYMVQTVDSIKLADLVDKAWAKLPKTHPLLVMIQVHTSGEESKSGISPDNVIPLFQHIAEKCPHLECAGLMTIGYADYDLELGPNPEYLALGKLRDSICEQYPSLSLRWDLSMGMSGDFEHAILHGSTCVRIGRVLFGARAKKEDV